MQVCSVLARPRLLYRFSLILLARVPHGERQHAARDERRFAARLCHSRDDPRSGLSPLPRGVSFRQACMRPGREARLHRLPAEGLPRMGKVAFWTQPIATAIDFMRATFRTAIETGDLIFACYGMIPIGHGPSAAERSARRGVARVGDGARLRPESQVRRRRGHHPEPATLHRDHAGPDRDFSTFSDAQFDEATFEAQVSGGPDALDDLLVLDPQTEGAVPVRRLRRGARGSRQGEAAPFGHSRSDSATRLLFVHRADGGGAL